MKPAPKERVEIYRGRGLYIIENKKALYPPYVGKLKPKEAERLRAVGYKVTPYEEAPDSQLKSEFVRNQLDIFEAAGKE